MSYVVCTRAHAALKTIAPALRGGAMAAALIAGVLLHCEHAFACSCVERTPQEAYAQAVSVFEGNVLEITAPAPGAQGAARMVRVRFAVVRSWKGMEQEQAEVTTAPSGAECGVTFAAGQNYLIYASSVAQGLRVDACSRTRSMDQADDDVRVLGLGATPVDPHPPESEKTVNTVSAQPHPSKGGCASCAVGGHPRAARRPSLVALAFVLWLGRRASKRRREAPARSDKRAGTRQLPKI